MAISFGKAVLICALAGVCGALAVPGASAQKNKKEKEKAASGAAASGAYSPEEIQAEFIDALQEKLIGNSKISLTLFSGFIKKYPNLAAGHFQFAELSASNGIYSQALPAYQRAVELEPQNKWYLVGLAELYDFLKMYKESKEVYKKLADLYPDELEFSLSAVSILVQEGKWSEAIALLDKIEQRIGVTPDINMEKYRLYMAQKKFTEALAELAKLQGMYPNESLYLGMAAEVNYARGDKKKALEAYEKILATDSNNTLVNLAMADYYQKEKNLEKSFFHLEKAFQNPGVEIDKKVMVLLSFLDQAKNSERHREEGQKLTKLLIEAHPADPKSWSISGDYLLEQKNWREALDAFVKAADLGPSKFILFHQIAYLAVRVEDDAALKKVTETMEEQFPMQPETYLYKGLYQLRTDKPADAEESLGYGKELVIENPLLASDFLSALGRTAALKKEPAKAYDYFDKAIAGAPDNHWAYLLYARSLAENGQYAKARTMADKSIALSPGIPEGYAVKARIQHLDNDPAGASESIEKALRNGGQQIKSVLLLYADITEKNGNPAKAAQIRAEANAI